VASGRGKEAEGGSGGGVGAGLGAGKAARQVQRTALGEGSGRAGEVEFAAPVVTGRG